MASANDFLGLLNCTIRFSTFEGEYEGVVRKVFPDVAPTAVVVGKIILLPSTRLGTLNFGFQEVSNIRVISRPDGVKEISVKEKDVLPVYPKTEIETLFDFDAGSDIEDGECADSQPTYYEMKLYPRLSKFVPNDFEIIDSFNRDFGLAIKHIKQQDEIGVSLEGIKISRSGTLTWLSISTKCCNFMFDILALGRKVFQEGLKSILEDGRIRKIFHDSRLASDCLFHKYGVCLVNVFDTQIADYIVMMQMNQKDQIGNRVNTLDACLNYYLGVPCDYLYGEANFSEKEDSVNFHALRPLRHDIQDVLIKNVMYLHLLKRELELALMIPLRRATNVYLNCVQKLTEKELLVVPHQPGELPLDMHLDGIQIFRYKDFEYACSTVASGPPYREINNPFKNYVHYHAEFKKGQREDKKSIVNKDSSENAKVASSKLKCETTVNYREASKSTCEKKPLAVNSFDRSSESDQECSDDSMKLPKYEYNPILRPGSDNDISKSQKSILKLEASQCRGASTVRHSLKGGVKEFLSRTSKENFGNVKPTSDQLIKGFSQISSGNVSVGMKAIASQSTYSKELPSFNSHGNPPVSNNTSKPVQLPRPPGKKSHLDLFRELRSRRKTSNSSAAHACVESSATDNMATSKAVCKATSKVPKDIDSVKSLSSEELVNDSEEKKDEDISDSDLAAIQTRVNARGALLRNLRTECSASDNPPTCDPFRSAQIKPKKNTGISSGNVETTSENVILYHRDALGKPSELVVTINHKRGRCLADLYREAGDHSMQLWNEDDSNIVPQSSSNELNKPTDDDDFWSRVLGDRSSQPMDERLRSRLVPAGMRGY